MLRLTLKEIETICKVKTELIVDDINNNLYVAWHQAAMVGLAVNNPKKFPTKVPKLKYKDESNKDKGSVADPDAVYKTIWNIAAMCGRTLENGPAE